MRTLLSFMRGLASGITASAQSYTDLDVSNQATIGAAIDLGSVQLGQTQIAEKSAAFGGGWRWQEA